MRTLLNHKIAAHIHSWVRTNVANNQPGFCCEITNKNMDHLISYALEYLLSWNTDQYLYTMPRGSGLLLYVVTQDELKNILSEQASKDETYSFVILNKVGGCTIDFSYRDDEIELLIVSWGVGKKLLKEMFESVECAELFREKE